MTPKSLKGPHADCAIVVVRYRKPAGKQDIAKRVVQYKIQDPGSSYESEAANSCYFKSQRREEGEVSAGG